MKNTAYLSLGANLGKPELQLRAAIERLAQLGTVMSVSSLYETEPVETAEAQPWFVNCALALETDLSPPQLLANLLAMEQSMGRKRIQPKGPRMIDMDIVLFGELIVNTPELTIPHPAMQERRFVLGPLAEIAPDAWHPVLKKTVRELLEALPATAGTVRRIVA